MTRRFSTLYHVRLIAHNIGVWFLRFSAFANGKDAFWQLAKERLAKAQTTDNMGVQADFILIKVFSAAPQILANLVKLVHSVGNVDLVAPQEKVKQHDAES